MRRDRKGSPSRETSRTARRSTPIPRCRDKAQIRHGLTRLAADDQAVHKLTELQNLPKQRSVHRDDPALTKRALGIMTQA